MPIAQTLTVPSTVTPRNIEQLKIYVRNGEEIHPGANYVLRSDGRRIKVTNINKEDLAEKLEFGWVVEPPVERMEISYSLNRQPSLHKMSIIAHSVKVLPDKTFRLNPAVCPPILTQT